MKVSQACINNDTSGQVSTHFKNQVWLPGILLRILRFCPVLIMIQVVNSADVPDLQMKPCLCKMFSCLAKWETRAQLAELNCLGL